MQNKDLTPTNLTSTNKNLNDMGKDTSLRSHETTVCLFKFFLVSQSEPKNENCFALINT